MTVLVIATVPKDERYPPWKMIDDLQDQGMDPYNFKVE